MSFTGKLGKEHFTAEKPFAVLGWPDQREVKEFDPQDELLKFIAVTAGENQCVFMGQAVEFKDGQWKGIKLPEKGDQCQKI